jgi:hypothetical protein
MANRLSDMLASMLSTPRVLVAPLREVVLFARATATFVVGDTGTPNAYIYPLVRLPAHARMIVIFLSHVAMVGSTNFDLTLYQAGDWNLGDQALVGPVDAFTLALNFTTGSSWGSPGLAAATTDYAAKTLWETAGLSSAPRSGTEYDVALTAQVAPAVAGTCTFGFLYTVGI